MVKVVLIKVSLADDAFLLYLRHLVYQLVRAKQVARVATLISLALFYSVVALGGCASVQVLIGNHGISVSITGIIVVLVV